MGIDRTTGTDRDTEDAENPKPADRPPPPPDQPGREPEGVPSRLESRKIAAAANEQSTENPAEGDSDASQPVNQFPTEHEATAEDRPESPPMSAPTDSDDRDQPTDGQAVEPAAESRYAPETGEQGERDQEAAVTDYSTPLDAIPQDDTDESASDDQSVRWQEHLERMQAEWAEHESRWPSHDSQGDDGPEGGPPAAGETPKDLGLPADHPQDEPGSWRGEGGQYLNYEENCAVSRVLDRGGQAEARVTQDLIIGKEQAAGAELVGLENRLKGADRFKEKAAEQLSAELRADPRRVAETIPDALRYTYQIPADNYVQGCQRIIEKIEQDGYERVFSRNTWDSSIYKGINTRWKTAEGQLFEVQFHTPESLAAKELTHRAYERRRNPTTSIYEAEELDKYQERVSSRIPIPKGVSEISDYRREDY